jgi:hypothetical protein
MQGFVQVAECPTLHSGYHIELEGIWDTCCRFKERRMNRLGRSSFSPSCCSPVGNLVVVFRMHGKTFIVSSFPSYHICGSRILVAVWNFNYKPDSCGATFSLFFFSSRSFSRTISCPSIPGLNCIPGLKCIPKRLDPSDHHTRKSPTPHLKLRL